MHYFSFFILFLNKDHMHYRLVVYAFNIIIWILFCVGYLFDTEMWSFLLVYQLKYEKMEFPWDTLFYLALSCFNPLLLCFMRFLSLDLMLKLTCRIMKFTLWPYFSFCNFTVAIWLFSSKCHHLKLLDDYFCVTRQSSTNYVPDLYHNLSFCIIHNHAFIQRVHIF